MRLIDNIIIIALIVASFISGKLVSDSYHRKTVEWMDYLLRLESAKHGVGYVAHRLQEKK